jgi:hypothetical protein
MKKSNELYSLLKSTHSEKFNNSKIGQLCVFTKCHVALISTVIGLSACGPRDVKVVDDFTRLKIKSSRGASKLKTTNEFVLGNYALSSLLIEKQIEALEIVRLSRGNLDSTKTQYTVTAVEGSEANIADGKKQIILKSTQDVLDFANSDGSWRNNLSKVVAVSLAEKEGQLVALEAKASQSKTNLQSVENEKIYTNLTEENYLLTLKFNEQNPELALLNLKIEGTLDVAKGTEVSANKFNLNVQISVDKDSLKSEIVKIVSSSATIFYPGYAGKTFSLKLNGTDLTVNGSGLCMAMNGAVDATTGNNSKFKIDLGQESIIVSDKKWTKTLATCGKRPDVDLSRFLIN